MLELREETCTNESRSSALLAAAGKKENSKGRNEPNNECVKRQITDDRRQNEMEEEKEVK